MRDMTNPSREGRRFVKSILAVYVKDMINDRDYERLEKELLDVIRAERRLASRRPAEKETPERFTHKKGEQSAFLYSERGGGLWVHHEGEDYGGKGWYRAVEVDRILSRRPASAVEGE